VYNKQGRRGDLAMNVMALVVTTGVFVGLSVWFLIAERYLANYGKCTIKLNEGDKLFELNGGGTLLSALYENKIFIPSAFGGKGSCRYCKVTVVEGGGPLLPTETPYLTRAERMSGVRLACQVKVKQDMEIKIPEELLYVQEFQARVSGVKELTRDIKEVTFELIEPNEISHRPGQYVQVRAPGPDGIVTRAYSISSPVYEKNIVQLVVRLVPGGIGSTYIHNLKEGDPVSFTGPYGEFRLNEDPEVENVCVGGGAGMAPIRCIIYSIFHRWLERSCWLFFGCRTTKDIFYMENYEELSKKHTNFK